MALSFSLHFLILYVDFLNVSISYFGEKKNTIFIKFQGNYFCLNQLELFSYLMFFGEIKLISLFTQKSFIFLTFKWEKNNFS